MGSFLVWFVPVKWTFFRRVTGLCASLRSLLGLKLLAV
uniref:Uncharacterized protein n=1 Tax=Arundo donax TaxID=35708 RepID=A0A0A9BVB7_ARUDO